VADPDYVSCPDVEDNDAFAARVHGDAMEPKYREGDIVIFSPAQKPKDGDDCFVKFADGQTTFKQCFFGKRTMRIEPRNKKYKGKTLQTTEISGVYKAVYKYAPVDEKKVR